MYTDVVDRLVDSCGASFYLMPRYLSAMQFYSNKCVMHYMLVAFC